MGAPSSSPSLAHRATSSRRPTVRCCTAAGSPRRRPRTDRRAFVELDGIFYYGDVWFDGDYLGTTEGYFVPHTFEVTDALRAASEHVLALEVACPPQRDRTAKRTVTGVFGHWDAADPEFNPGGPWRPIRIVETGRGAHRRRCACCAPRRSRNAAG